MIIKKIVKKLGGSGYVSLPAKYIGKEATITIDVVDSDYLTKKQIITLIEDKVEEAKRGY